MTTKKVQIFTFSNSRPDFIKRQCKYLNKFITEDFEYIVFNTSVSDNERNAIHEMCNLLNVKCLDCDRNHRWCSQIDYYVLNKLERNHISIILDSDVFPINYFNFSEYINNYDIAGIYQQRQNYLMEYLWIAFLIIDNNKILDKGINLSVVGYLDGDAGASTSFVLNKLNVKWVKHTADIENIESLIFEDNIINQYEANFGSQIIENSFFHYYRGSNWDNQDHNFHIRKTKFLDLILENAPIKFTNKLNEYQTYCAHSSKHWNGIRNNTNINITRNFICDNK